MEVEATIMCHSQVWSLFTMNIKLFVLEEANTSYTIIFDEITSSPQGSCLAIKVSNAP